MLTNFPDTETYSLYVPLATLIVSPSFAAFTAFWMVLYLACTAYVEVAAEAVPISRVVISKLSESVFLTW
jgi:hypothetical protein